MHDLNDNGCVTILLAALVVYLLYTRSNYGPAVYPTANIDNMDNTTTTVDTVAQPPVKSVPVMGPSCPGVDETTPFIDPKTGMLIDGPGYDGGLGSLMKVSQGTIPSNYYFLDDGANGEMSVTNNIVSPACCGETWPTPFQQRADPYVCANKDKFVQSRMYGNNTYQDSGCMCTSKKQAEFLYNRGNNAGGWF